MLDSTGYLLCLQLGQEPTLFGSRPYKCCAKSTVSLCRWSMKPQCCTISKLVLRKGCFRAADATRGEAAWRDRSCIGEEVGSNQALKLPPHYNIGCIYCATCLRLLLLRKKVMVAPQNFLCEAGGLMDSPHALACPAPLCIQLWMCLRGRAAGCGSASLCRDPWAPEPCLRCIPAFVSLQRCSKLLSK